MGQSCNLYINSKWTAREIRQVVSRIVGKEVKFQLGYGDADPDYQIIALPEQGMMIHVFFNHETPVGTVTLLSRGATHGVPLLEQIAKVFGGYLMRNDCDGNIEQINGNMDDDNGLPYFVRYAIVHDGIDPSNLPDLKQSINKWYDYCDPANKPYYLRENVT